MSPVENLESLVKETTAVNINEFLRLANVVVELQANEQGHVGSLQITGKLVNLMPKSEAIVVGDLHGDLESLHHILKATGFIERIKEGKQCLLVFLGDYGDRGIHSPEVYYVVLRLKEAFPKNVVLMRGNHEGPDDILAHPHDLPDHLYSKFGDKSSQAYDRLRELFRYLHTAVLVNERYVLLHGGVPTQATTVEDLAYAHEKHPRETHLEEILWSDPWEGLAGVYASPRGAGRLFGEKETNRLLNMLNVDVLIRGHEPSQEGFKLNHSGKVLTLFSRRGPPYFNAQAAYLQLDLSFKAKDANQLNQFMKRF
ncbi:MAG: metallophosphoesterase family protein [Candidatus Bathyarchaeota archaeon]|jgi:protein phosphatase